MKPKLENLNIIADTFGINPVWLLGYDVPMFKVDNIEQDYPFYLNRIECCINKINEQEREVLYNVMLAIFPNRFNK